MARRCLLTLLILSAACSRDAADYIARGNQLSKEGKFQDAALSYRKAIQRNAQSGEAYYRLGSVLIKSRDLEGAYDALQQATHLLPDHEESKVALADLCLTSYAAIRPQLRPLYEQSLKLTESILLQRPDSPDGLRLRASISLLDKNPKQAIDLLEKARRLSPQDPKLQLLHAEALFEIGNTQEGENLVRSLIRTHKTYGPAFDALAARLMGMGKGSQAEAVLREGVEANPGDAERIFTLARFHYASRNLPQVRTIVEALRKQSPSQMLEASDFYAEVGMWEDARRVYAEGLSSDPKRKMLYLSRLLRAYKALGDHGRLDSTVVEILKEEPRNVEALLARARRQIENGNMESASEEIDRLVKENPDNVEALELVGQAQRRRGNLDAAITAFRASQEIQPRAVGPRLEVANLFLAKRQFAEAIRATDEILALQPDHRQAMLLRIAALADSGQFAEARTQINVILKAAPDDREAKLQLALVDIRSKRFEAAENSLRGLYRAQGDDPRPLMALVVSQLARKQTSEAMALLEGELKERPKSNAIRRILADTALLTGDADRAITHYSYLLTKGSPAAELLARLGSAYQRKGDVITAIQHFEKAERLAPNQARLSVLAGAALKQAGKLDEAAAAYRRALIVEPNNIWALNNLAYLLSETGRDLDAALASAQRASRLAPAHPMIQDTLGWILHQRQAHEQARQIFAQLVADYPDIAVFRYHFGMVLIKSGDRQRAKAELESALLRKPGQQDERKIREALAQLG